MIIKNWLLFLVLWLVVILGGCQPGQEDKAEEDWAFPGAFDMEPPGGWYFEDEAEREEGVINLSLRSKEDDRGGLIITYLPANLFSAERAKEKGRQLLEASLVDLHSSPEESFQNMETEGIKGEVTVYKARAGEDNSQHARTAVVNGEEGHLLVTLLKREEASEYFLPQYEKFLESLVLP